MKRLISSALLSILATITLSDSAKAGQYDVIHKWVNPVDNSVYLYIPNQLPGQPLQTFKVLQKQLRQLKTNNCGIAKIIDKETNPIQGFKTESGGSFSQSINDTAPVPNCTLNSSTGLYESNWNPTTNSALKIVDTWFLKIATNLTVINVNVWSRKVTTSKPNDCGFVRIKKTINRTLDEFEVNSISYGLDSLPTVTAPMICKKGVEYQPKDQ